MVFASMFLSWALLVQVQIHVCQDGVCTPHPRVQPKARVVRTLATEVDCLTTQLQLQQELTRLRAQSIRPVQDRRHLETRTSRVWVSEQETKGDRAQ
jgi:hypothetical protein